MLKNKPNIIYILCDDLGYGDVSSLNSKARIKTPNIDALAKKGQSFLDAHSSSAVCTPSRYSVMTGRYDFRTRLKEGVFLGYDLPLIEAGRLTVPAMLRKNGYKTHMVGKWHLGLDWKCKDGRYVSEGGDVNSATTGGNIDFNVPFQGGPCDRGFDTFFGIVASLDMSPYVYLKNRHAVETEALDGDTRPYAAGIDGLSTYQNELRKCTPRPGPADRGLRPDKVLNDLTNRTIDIIGNAEKDEPFYLYMPLTAPHTPVVPSAGFVGKSGTDDQYLDFVLEIDDCLGRVVNALETIGIRDNTMIVFTSDNGPEVSMYKRRDVIDHYSAGEFRGAKRDSWDGGHRIPFIVSWPEGIPQGKEISETVCLTDFMATAAAIVSYDLPDNAGEDSYNLLPLMLQGSNASFLREATVHHSCHGCFAIRKGEWKLLLHPGSGGNRYDGTMWNEHVLESEEDTIAADTPVQLYRRDGDDIAEKQNLYLEHPEIVEELGQLMIEYIDNGRSTPGENQLNDSSENRWQQVEDAIQNLTSAKQ
jgi:arylsulfatase A